MAVTKQEKEIYELVGDTMNDFPRKQRHVYSKIVKERLPDFLGTCLDVYNRQNKFTTYRQGNKFYFYLRNQGIKDETAKAFAWLKFWGKCGQPFPKEAVEIEKIPKADMAGLERMFKSFENK